MFERFCVDQVFTFLLLQLRLKIFSIMTRKRSSSVFNNSDYSRHSDKVWMTHRLSNLFIQCL